MAEPESASLKSSVVVYLLLAYGLTLLDIFLPQPQAVTLFAAPDALGVRVRHAALVGQ